MDIEIICNTVINDTCINGMKMLPDDSIDCIITSPPYWQLRDYGYNEQWGLEPTFQLYLCNLWHFMSEAKRVLKKTGTCWVNLGDTYSGSKQGDNDPKLNDGVKHKSQVNKSVSDVANKSLLLIPHRFAIGCIDAGWILRNDIIWAKRNGMPESVTDRFSKKHEYFFFMTKEEKYYFDLDSIRDRRITNVVSRNKASEIYGRGSGSTKFSEGYREWGQHDLGKNPGSVSDFWDIPTKPSSKNHFATYNTKLIDKPIMAGCPIGGIILDPFCGTATTGCRSIELGRRFIGIEASAEYAKIASKQIEPLTKINYLF